MYGTSVTPSRRLGRARNECTRTMNTRQWVPTTTFNTLNCGRLNIRAHIPPRARNASGSWGWIHQRRRCLVWSHPKKHAPQDKVVSAWPHGRVYWWTGGWDARISAPCVETVLRPRCIVLRGRRESPRGRG